VTTFRMSLPTSFDVVAALNVDHYDSYPWANASSGARTNRGTTCTTSFTVIIRGGPANPLH